MLFHGPKQVLLPATNFYIRLVDAPRGRSRALIPAHSLLQFRRIAMHPAHDRRRVYSHAAVLHRILQIPVRSPVLGLDDVDLRCANEGRLAGKEWNYGVLVGKTPTAENVWNDWPSWGFRYLASSSTVVPLASPIINMLDADVADVGEYSMWNNHLSTDMTLYRSEHSGAATRVTGTGYPANISGVAPHWRAAWQQDWHGNYLELGAYGMYVNSFSGAISGPQDRDRLEIVVQTQLPEQIGQSLAIAKTRSLFPMLRN